MTSHVKTHQRLGNVYGGEKKPKLRRRRMDTVSGPSILSRFCSVRPVRNPGPGGYDLERRPPDPHVRRYLSPVCGTSRYQAR
ncbi:hypothetical protein P7K49_002428 [Saguinus oedipus]|uniref:Uncharacterized protein n=1 Tax=Saguinus oedipus TaxID=9490 RepID=A0ABQ9WL88_SAGOE|nr:hypothetical protein P7K49_002428 [Saguinus oedipus]